jgi:hypothetical protein
MLFRPAIPNWIEPRYIASIAHLAAHVDTMTAA